MTDHARAAAATLTGAIEGKPTSASRTTLSHIMTHSDTNLLGTVHGGVIMKLVDDAAGAGVQQCRSAVRYPAGGVRAYLVPLAARLEDRMAGGDADEGVELGFVENGRRRAPGQPGQPGVELARPGVQPPRGRGRVRVGTGSACGSSAGRGRIGRRRHGHLL